MRPEDEAQIHLAEYQALRNESDHYSQRIDKMSGLYLTALFGIAGYLLRPDSKFDIDSYISAVEASASLTTLFISLTILNSVLLIRIVSFFSGVLAITQYCHYVIRPRLIALVGHEVLSWDDSPRMSAKKTWLPLRSLGQLLFIIVAKSVSIALLISSRHALSMEWPFLLLYAVAWILLIVSLGSLIAVGLAGSRFHQPGHNGEDVAAADSRHIA